MHDPYEAYAGDEYLPFDLSTRPPASGDERPEPQPSECDACDAVDDEYVWVSERWRVRGTRRPTGVPVVLGLEPRPHLDLGDLPNLLAAEFGVMTVRLEKAIRSLAGVEQVHVARWAETEGHLRVWFLARPQGSPRLRGPHLAAWDRALPPGDEAEWRARLGMVAAWLAEFGGRAVVDPPRIAWLPLGDLGPA